MQNKQKPKVMAEEREMDTFNLLVKDQFAYGGKKYAGNEKNPKREATDDLVDDFTYLWLIGTFGKYGKRFTNLARERDLLKVGCYMYITWLKRGFHFNPQGSDKIIDTNVEIKEEFYINFTEMIYEYSKSIEATKDVQVLYDKFKEIVNRQLDVVINSIAVNPELTVRQFIQNGFNNITEEDLIYIYKSCFLIWDSKYKNNPGMDTDTHNEKK